ncbi:WD40 repeat-containing protein [Leptolyngbyaceae cyanobacterium JSC-12]|nr:WD40 repeat-containing protein [Leptolyngbyaceae cyanobacterium JSC-12]
MLRDALVVGINSYQYLPALNAPAHDAEAIAHQLESNGDFRVTRLPEIIQSEKLRVGVRTPVTLAELEASLVKLFKPKGETIPHTALFYFSGHGLQKEAGIREGYLATSDANPNAHFYGLSLFWLRRLLQESPVRQRIILLDCCYSGEILNFLEADPGAKSGTDRLFMAASREYETAYEALNGQYSVFTQAVLDGLDPRRLPTGIVTNYALTDWVSNALKGESQQPLFENSGSEIVLTRCHNPLTTLQSNSSQDICPYRGLEPFEEGHAEYFFGREHLTDQLLNKLRTENFVAIVGASGSGKSSLVRAGLVYKLQRGQALSGSHQWQIRVITPTEHPMKSLANAFMNPATTAVDRAEQLRRAEMFLQEGTSGLTQLIRASLIAENKSTRMVLIIDQFEEIFTLCQGPNADRDRHRFFNCLLAAAREASDQFSLVIVLRADFFSKCLLYKGLAEQIEQHLIMVTPLSYEQIKASIIKPANRVGLVCEPNLVYNILLDIVGAPGELPLLQYTLLELWQRRHQDPNGGPPRLTLDAYAELGGVRGTLQKRADEIFYSLSPEEQRVAKRIFIALTQLGEGTEDTRRRVLKSELVSPRFSAELVERVLEKLVIAKLVVTNQVTPISSHQERVDQRFANVSTALRLAQVMRTKSAQSGQTAMLTQSLPQMQASLAKGYNLNVTRLSHVVDFNAIQPSLGNACHETVDIAHEALIRNWGLLRSWLDESREMLRRQRQIERSAREWNLADQTRSPEYLLRGSRLLDAEDFLTHYSDELSALAQRYIAVSREETRRTKRELRVLQVSVPCTLMVALGITFAQYRVADKSQTEKNFQLQVATSRQWSAIAQSILQEPDSDSTTALLISRLAAEQGRTYEAEASLRAALQQVRLQATLQADNVALQQVAFSPNYQSLATLDTQGTIRLWSFADRRVQRVLQGESTEQRDRAVAVFPTPATLAFSADGNWLAAVAQGAVEVRIWSVETGELQHRLGAFPAAISQFAIDPTGQLIAASSGNTVKIWEIATGKLRAERTQPGLIKSLQFSADGTQLLVAEAQTVMVLQVPTNRPQRLLSKIGFVESAVLSPDAQWIAIANPQGEIRLWHTQTGKLLQTITESSQNSSKPFPLVAPSLMFSPDGQRLAALSANGRVVVKNLQSGMEWTVGQSADNLPGKAERQRGAIAFTPDSQQIIIAGHPAPHNAAIRDAATGRELGSLKGHTGTITAIQPSQDGSLIATVSADGTMRLWTTTLGGELPSLDLPNVAIQSTSFQPDNGLLALGSDGSFRRWQLRSRTNTSTPSIATIVQPTSIAGKLGEPITSDARLTGIFASSDGKRFAITTDQNLIEVWQMQPDHSLTRLYTLQPAIPIPKTSAQAVSHPSQASTIHRLAFSQDGQMLVGAGVDKTLHVWDLASGQLVHQLKGHEASIEHVHFSPDGKQIISASWDRTARIWDTSSGALVRTLAHSDVVTSAQFSPNGQRILTTSLDSTARILDANTGALQVILAGHRGAVLDGSFSPDGQWLVTASADGTARLWDANTGVERATLRPVRATAAQEVIKQVAFSPDGQQIATLGSTGIVHLWAANWEGLLELARDRSPRQLTSEECLRYLRLTPSACPSLVLSSNS